MQNFMDYLLLTDFVISNTDRHLMNFGVLRDAGTQRFLSPAPIFDSGNSMFYMDRLLPDLQQIEINSFAGTEMKQLKYIKNKQCVDVVKLPGEGILDEIYRMDPAHEVYLLLVNEGYRKKVDMLRQLQ